jgi:hypothetical protein
MNSKSNFFLNQSDKLTSSHYMILCISSAGWIFDFYNLMLFSFLVVPIKKSLGISDYQISVLMGVSLGATALV